MFYNFNLDEKAKEVSLVYQGGVLELLGYTAVMTDVTVQRTINIIEGYLE